MIIAAVIIFIIFIIIAHVFAPEGYCWKTDTVSRLADQAHSYAWILRAGMITYGIILIAATAEISFTSIMIAAYGLGVIATGVFTVEKYERIHMFSIYTAGAALSIAMLMSAITGSMVSILCLAFMIAAELIFNIKIFAGWRGISQRAVHLSTLIWLAALDNGFIVS